MLDIETRKYRIINQINNLAEDNQIKLIEEFLKKVFLEEQHDYLDIFKPIKEDIDIDDMVKEQAYEGIDRLVFNKLIDEIDVKEPLEYLLDIN